MAKDDAGAKSLGHLLGRGQDVQGVGALVQGDEDLAQVRRRRRLAGHAACDDDRAPHVLQYKVQDGADQPAGGAGGHHREVGGLRPAEDVVSGRADRHLRFNGETLRFQPVAVLSQVAFGSLGVAVAIASCLLDDGKQAYACPATGGGMLRPREARFRYLGAVQWRQYVRYHFMPPAEAGIGHLA